MKLLLVCYEYPPIGGGAGNALAFLAREFAAAGDEVCVLTSAFGELPAFEREGSLAVRRVAAGRRRADRCSPAEMLFYMASASWAALRLASQTRFDATLAFFGIPGGPVGWLLRRTHGIPYVVSLRGGDVPGFQPYDLALHHRVLGPLIGFLWRRAAAVVANSAGLRALALRFAPDVPVGLIPNGVDLERFSPRPPAPRPGPVELLFVGRLVRQKGVDVLLEALALLPAGAEFRLTLVGDGDARPALEAQAQRLGLRERVEFAGWRDRAALPETYRAADVFVFASRDEGMPNVLLEAMASGLPAVATRIAGNEELVEDGASGRLVPADDPGALARALAPLLAQPELRAAWGARARAIVEERYSWRGAAAAFRALLANARPVSL